MMKFKVTLAALLATTLSAGMASAAVDTYDYTDAAALVDFGGSSSNSNYFIPPGNSPTDSPYYRGSSEDWGWMHDAIPGASSSSEIKLNVSNYDVDDACGSGACEVDNIFGYDAAGNGGAGEWLLIGALTGQDNAYSFTEFTLDTALYDDVETGLKLWMDIDVLTAGWIVTLAKSVITTAGESPGNPNPGAQVPLPAAGWLMLAGFGGLAAMRRRKSKS